MSDSNAPGRKPPWIPIVVVIAVLVSAALYLWPRNTTREAPEEPPPAEASRGAFPSSTPQPAIRPRAPLPGHDAGPDLSGRASIDVPPSRRVVATAPAAIPSRITQEKDPAKRAKLTRMHRLATARVRVALLDRRRELLRRTLNKAKADPSASNTSPKELERQLRRLERALAEARRHRASLEKAGVRP